LGRIAPQRVDWRTLEQKGVAPTTAAGDAVVIFGESEELRGRLAAPIGAGIHVELEQGSFCSAPVSQTVPERLRLRFHTTALKPGDEFTVRSRSGKTYRGLALEVRQWSLTAELRPDR